MYVLCNANQQVIKIRVCEWNLNLGPIFVIALLLAGDNTHFNLMCVDMPNSNIRVGKYHPVKVRYHRHSTIGCRKLKY